MGTAGKVAVAVGLGWAGWSAYRIWCLRSQGFGWQDSFRSGLVLVGQLIPAPPYQTPGSAVDVTTGGVTTNAVNVDVPAGLAPMPSSPHLTATTAVTTHLKSLVSLLRLPSKNPADLVAPTGTKGGVQGLYGLPYGATVPGLSPPSPGEVSDAEYQAIVRRVQ